MSYDICSSGGYPGRVVSNFANNEFTFDGVYCASMEGLLQAFKFARVEHQTELCALIGLDAKFRGLAGNGWRKHQTLHWAGVKYDRHSPEYQKLLDRAYRALSKNNEFRIALLDTGNKILTHRVGSTDPYYTVITRDEFTGRLMGIRDRLRG